jgi:signal transduction histidine kinase
MRWHELDVRRINDPATGQPMILVNEKDITDRKLLEQKLQEYTTQLQQSLTFEAMLKRITDKVRDSLDQSQILQTVVQELCFGLGVTCCNTALYDLEQGTSTICYEYATTNPGAQMRVAQIALFPEVYQHLLDGQYLQFCSITPNPRRGQVAMLACPIFDDKGVLGDLWLINHKNHAFNELEIRLVQQVANQCAIAIRQARLYQASLVQVEELEKLNQLKDDFLSTVSHELRTPISNMKMAIQMLKISPTNERRERYLEILQAECTREQELINDLLDLQKLETASCAIVLNEAINLQDWLPKMIEPFESRIQESKQTLQINLSPVPPLIIDRASLQRILAELLNNACKYTPASGEIGLSVCYKLAEAVTIFTISNPTEIPADQLPRVFEKFYRVPKGDRWQKGGTGLGLALVKKLVEQLQGTIVVESSQGWTTFTVTLPNEPQEGARDQGSGVRE